MNAPFLDAEAVIIAAQAALVGLPGRGVPRWLERFTGRGWALILPLSIAVVVAAITLVPEVADALTWISLILIPPGAFLALGWAMHGARAGGGALPAAAARARAVRRRGPRRGRRRGGR